MFPISTYVYSVELFRRSKVDLLHHLSISTIYLYLFLFFFVLLLCTGARDAREYVSRSAWLCILACEGACTRSVSEWVGCVNQVNWLGLREYCFWFFFLFFFQSRDDVSVCMYAVYMQFGRAACEMRERQASN